MASVKGGWRVGSLLRSQPIEAYGATALWFGPAGWVPNSARLPALLYTRAIAGAECTADAYERLLRGNGWLPQWRNGIYDYHHFHSTAHEVLGVASGSAQVRLGGPSGEAVAIAAGDCVFLPAGTGHCLLAASPDLLVVGAYPPGQRWDLRRDALSLAEHAAMAALPDPATDPVGGPRGALLDQAALARHPASKEV
ncbi:MAG: cupin domain-containing protein [Hyphomicrobiaceae bacterium]|nr:cupin domain-containing protein [Hyphomicrobiaceae bacterium]